MFEKMATQPSVIATYVAAIRAVPRDLWNLSPFLKAFTVTTVAAVTLSVHIWGDERNRSTALLDGIVHVIISIYMALMVNRRISVFIWGLLLSATYLRLALREGLYAQLGVHVFFVCVQPWGVRNWMRARDGHGQSKPAPCVPWVVSMIAVLAALLLTYVGITWTTDSSTRLFRRHRLAILDWIVAMLSVAAQLLTLACRAEAFLLWVLINIVGVNLALHLGLWKLTVAWGTYFAYSLLGTRSWINAANTDDSVSMN